MRRARRLAARFRAAGDAAPLCLFGVSSTGVSRGGLGQVTTVVPDGTRPSANPGDLHG